MFAFVVFGLIGGINFGYPVFDDNEFSMHVNVRNDGDDDLRRLYGFDNNIQDGPGSGNDDVDDVQVRAFIPDLGLMYSSTAFDLDDHNIHSKILFGDSEANLCGQWVKISVSNDEARRSKWRQILC